MPSQQPRSNKLADALPIASRIATGDYFANLATVLDLIRQDIHWKRPAAKQNNVQLSALRDELLVLQKDYRIIRKH
jgi:hypothetical protein